MMQSVAKYLRVAPNKVRRVLNQIRGKSYVEAVMVLGFMPYSACKPILRVLQSAGANAETTDKVKKTHLYVAEACADAGPILKRFRPRAQGRTYKIQKPTCHVRISLLQIH
uniref:Large ribosomal subunit protein uL22c n=1 Tax=Cryptomonas sp. CCAC 1634B TaxID=2051848 RepID=A0A679CAC5_9CRYP|nr:ribosomal protein L22 [Cryptomonas sp. CCAC 1634B]